MGLWRALGIVLVRFLDVLGISLVTPGTGVLLGSKPLLLGTLIVVGLLIIVPLLTGAVGATTLSTEVEVGGISGLTLVAGVVVIEVFGSWEPKPLLEVGV